VHDKLPVGFESELPANAATNGDNNLDNVEQISIPNPTVNLSIRVNAQKALVDDTGAIVRRIFQSCCPAIFHNPDSCRKSPPSARKPFEHRRAKMGATDVAESIACKPMAI